MIGFILALGTALSEASKDIISKYNLKYIDEYVGAFSLQLTQSLLLLPLALFFLPKSLSDDFILVVLTSSFIQLAVILLYFKAIKISEISVTLPLLTLTPLFMLITSPIMIGEFPSFGGLLGIFLIVSGTYISNFKSEQKNVLTPFVSLVKDKGARYMLVIAFLWSITANLDLIGVRETSPIFWSFGKDFLILLYMVPIMLVKSTDPWRQIMQRRIGLFWVGFFKSTSVITQMFSIQFILVAYTISIKRSSAIFIILYAFFLLKERANFKNRIIGISIILIGLILIALN